MAPRTPSIALALTRALRDTQPLQRDQATVALARRYAALIEEAQSIATELDRMVPEGDAQAKRIRALAAKVESQSVASDLGPKLLAALTALGMNPAGRAAGMKGGSPGASDPAADALARLRAVRGRG